MHSTRKDGPESRARMSTRFGLSTSSVSAPRLSLRIHRLSFAAGTFVSRAFKKPQADTTSGLSPAARHMSVYGLSL